MSATEFRIGNGYDVHPLKAGRKLLLGGVEIPHSAGLVGHSDADVLLHAVSDAVLGALAGGDIGQWFPEDQERYRNADSTVLLRKIITSRLFQGWRLGNLDCTVIAEKPRLAEHIPGMRENLARLFSAAVEQVSVKATTCEGLGFIGRGEGIAANASVILVVCETENVQIQ